MSRKTRPQVFDVPLFGGELVLCRSRAEWAYAMKHYGQEDDSEEFRGGLAMSLVDKETGQRSYVIGVFDNSAGTLSHEIAHAVFYILDNAGVELKGGGTNETFCYLLGHLMRASMSNFPRIW